MKKSLFLLLLFSFFQFYAQESNSSALPLKEASSSSENSEKSSTPLHEENLIVDGKLFNQGYFEREILRFENHIKDYQKELNSLIGRSVEEKKRNVKEKYDFALSKEEKKEAQNREDAIVLFEDFIKKYPDNEKYTPSAIYRLSELYYEKSMILYSQKTAEYEAAIAKFENKEIPQEPTLPEVDLSNSIKLYKKLIREFPNYAYIGTVYYMLGYCYSESGFEEDAVKIWTELLRKNFPSTNYAELHLRLGDYYFSENTLEKAEFHYREGKKYTESNFFDKILYKLAWTYYRQSRFEDAVKAFTELLFFSDDMKKQGLDKGQDLRKEAIQYIAISYADDEWGSADKAIAYFTKIKADSFEKDVFEQLGKYYFENNKYTEAEKAYRFILNRYPYCENAPRIHHKLIQLANKAREFDKAARETEIFAKFYDSSGKWAKVNRGNATIVREAVDLAKNALLDSAAFHHRQAQTFKEKNETEQSVQEYRMAATLYEEYLNKFPYVSESYDVSYNFADALFYSGDIKTAVVIYEQIRDDKNQDKFRDDAAFQTFFCYNSLWEKSAGRQASASTKLNKSFTPIETKLIESSDIYFETAKEVEDKPNVAYNVARIFYDHGKFEEAEKRYLKIISEFPDSRPAHMASQDIVAAYTEKKDWINVAKWSKILLERLSSKTKTDKKVKQEFATYRSGALFKYAQKLENEKKYLQAATEYLRIVEENPYADSADKAIYNAAINYSRATMFESALKLHERIYKEYPYSELAPQSLYLVAYNAEMSYDHEKAVNAYKALYEKYPNYKEKSNAIYNAGFLLEKLQKYKESAVYYKLYYSENKKRLEGKEALYDVGRLYQKAKDWERAIKAYEDFISSFRNDSEVGHLVARAYYQIAKIEEEKLNKWKMAKVYYNKILLYLEEKKVVSDESLAYAAESKFKLLEDDFNDYLKMKIIGKNDKQLEENLKKKVETMKKMEDKYMDVIKFQVYDWTMASLYRVGFLYQSFSDALFEAEPPSDLNDEEQEIYTDMLKTQAEPIEEAAVQKYSSALEKAKEMKAFNKWTQLITEKLSVLRPSEYRVGKTPMFAKYYNFDSGYSVALSLDKSEKKIYKKAGLGEAKQEKQKSPQEKTEKVEQ